MKQLDSVRVTVEFREPDEEAIKKQSFNDVVMEPTEAKLLALGAIVTKLAPVGSQLEAVVKTEQTRYTKD